MLHERIRQTVTPVIPETPSLPIAPVGRRVWAAVIDFVACFILLFVVVAIAPNQVPLTQLLMFGAWLGYFALMEIPPRQASFGKLLLGLMITDERGAPLTRGNAFGRIISKLLLAGSLIFTIVLMSDLLFPRGMRVVVNMVGYASPFILLWYSIRNSPTRQFVDDQAAHSLVLDARALRQMSRPVATTPDQA